MLGPLAAGPPARSAPPAPQVVGGTDVPDPNPYVWQVSIGTGDAPYAGHRCGGSLVAPRWVLSAGHCFRASEVGDPSRLRVVVGARTLSQAVPEQIRQVRRVVVHPGFDLLTLDDDLALAELDAPAAAPAAPIALASPAEDATLGAPGVLATLTGWGGLKGYGPGEPGPPGGQAYADTLQLVALPVLDPDVCAAVFGPIDAGRKLCAGYEEGGRDSCEGDSGGALVASAGGGAPRQIGIVSSGIGCAAPSYPGLYTRVAPYAGWVRSVIAPLPLTARLFLPQLGR